jgi:hypothetical protein
LVAEARAAWERRAKGEVEDDDEDDPEMLLDYHAYRARKFRDTWNCLYFGYCGSFEDTSEFSPSPSPSPYPCLLHRPPLAYPLVY